MTGIETLLQELVDARAELARARACKLESPAQAVNPGIHTPARVTAYLALCGWVSRGCGGATAEWAAPDNAVSFLVPLRQSDPDYARRIGRLAAILAARGRTGELDILAAIAEAPATDWREVRAAQLLARIRAAGGVWSDARARRELLEISGRFWSHRAALKLLHLLEQRGELVPVRPPLGRTFQLPDGPAQAPRIEWGNRREIDGRREIASADSPPRDDGGEARAVGRMCLPEYTAVLRRTVTYGPWTAAIRHNVTNYD